MIKEQKYILARGNEVILQLLNMDFSKSPIGDFSDPLVALWSSKTFQLLSSVSMSGSIHDIAFSPSAANQLACVGSHGVYFCCLHKLDTDVDFMVNDSRKIHSQYV